MTTPPPEKDPRDCSFAVRLFFRRVINEFQEFIFIYFFWHLRVAVLYAFWS